MGRIIKANGKKESIVPSNGKYYQLKEQQKIVGGLIQHINLMDGWIMTINEEGKLFGLPINDIATEIYRTSIYLERGFDTSDFIVGDVLICKSDEIR